MTQEKRKATGKIKFVDERQKLEIARLVNPFDLFDKLGIEVYKERPGQIRGCCPIHGGDNPTSFSIDFDPSGLEAPVWMCRTKCGTSGDMYKLMQMVNKCGFLDAVNWIADFVGITDIGVSKTIRNADFAHEDDVRKFRKEVGNRGVMLYNKSDYVCPDINEKFVKECMSGDRSYFIDRGFSAEELDFYEIGFCPAFRSEWKEDRLVVPIRDSEGVLVGISGRTLYETKHNKYKILMGTNKGETLYGLNWALPYIIQNRAVILVEGFTDVWRCRQHGKFNVVAVMGKDLTHEQRKILLSLVHTVVVAFDGDKVGRMQSDNVVEKLINFLTVYQMIPPEEKDLGDLNKKEFFNLCVSAQKRS